MYHLRHATIAGRQVQQLLHDSPEFEVVGLVRQDVPDKTMSVCSLAAVSS